MINRSAEYNVWWIKEYNQIEIKERNKWDKIIEIVFTLHFVYATSSYFPTGAKKVHNK